MIEERFARHFGRGRRAEAFPDIPLNQELVRRGS